MRTYSFYVGSTDAHNAHAPFALTPTFARMGLPDSVPTLTHGIWEGTTENVAIYTVSLATDVQAQRLAFALAVLTGNDAILVVRDTDRDDYSRTFGSTAAYRVDIEHVLTGNRTMYPADPFEPRHYGYRYTPAVGGVYVAFLVGLDNTVTPVQ